VRRGSIAEINNTRTGYDVGLDGQPDDAHESMATKITMIPFHELDQLADQPSLSDPLRVI
jgi:hypothetical protein